MKSLQDILTTALPPWIHLVVGEESQLVEWLSHVTSTHEKMRSAVVRILSGESCPTKQSLLEEIAWALEFPPYFGHNWDALDECLADLGDWLPAEAYILVFTKANDLLSQSEQDFKTLMEVLQSAGAEWANRSIPFHTILHCQHDAKDTMLKRLSEMRIGFSIVEW